MLLEEEESCLFYRIIVPAIKNILIEWSVSNFVSWIQYTENTRATPGFGLRSLHSSLAPTVDVWNSTFLYLSPFSSLSQSHENLFLFLDRDIGVDDSFIGLAEGSWWIGIYLINSFLSGRIEGGGGSYSVDCDRFLGLARDRLIVISLVPYLWKEGLLLVLRFSCLSNV